MANKWKFCRKVHSFFPFFFLMKLLQVVGCMKPSLIISIACHNRIYSAEIHKTVDLDTAS